MSQSNSMRLFWLCFSCLHSSCDWSNASGYEEKTTTETQMEAFHTVGDHLESHVLQKENLALVSSDDWLSLPSQVQMLTMITASRGSLKKCEVYKCVSARTDPARPFHPGIYGRLPRAHIIYHNTPVGVNLIPEHNGLEFKEENAERKLFQRSYFTSNLRWCKHSYSYVLTRSRQSTKSMCADAYVVVAGYTTKQSIAT